MPRAADGSLGVWPQPASALARVEARLRGGLPAAEGPGAGGEAKRERVPAAARAYAVSLMGGVLVAMCTFYFVNWPDPDVRLSTWQVLNMTVSIFCSVLIYGTVKGFLSEQLAVKTQEGYMILNLSLFCILYLALQVMLYAMMKGSAEKSELRSAGTILAHITGFAAMYSGAGILAIAFLVAHPAVSFSVVLGMGLVLYALVLGGEKVREAAALADDGFISASEREWMEEVEEVEDDVLCLCLGFCFMQVVRRMLTGEPQPFEAIDQPLPVTQTTANWLLGVSILTALLTVVSAMLRHRMKISKRYSGSSINVIRFMGVVRNTFSTSMAWCSIYWVEWQIYVLELDSLRIECLLIQALVSTILSFVLILVLDFIADRSGHSLGLRRVIFSLGLLVGFSWERAFDVGFEQHISHHAGPTSSFRHILPLVLALFVLPAWKQYILPHTSPVAGMHAAMTTVSADIAARTRSNSGQHSPASR